MLKMYFMLAIVVLFATSVYAQEAASGGADLAIKLAEVIDNAGRKRAVVVENWIGQTVRMWCSSKQNRIKHDGLNYIDLKDQESMGWSFTPNVFPGFSGETLFWCTFCYKNQKRGWNVYDQKWEKMEDDGVPKNGVLKWRIAYDSVLWEDESKPRKGWDFASWPSEGDC